MRNFFGKRIVRVVGGFVALLACVLLFLGVSSREQRSTFTVMHPVPPNPSDPAWNPYHLNTEEGFARAYAEKILPRFNRPESSGWFSGVGGIEVYYRTFPVQPPVNEQGVVVISNGRTESLMIYPELIWELNQNGYSVYVFDHRGQGFSGRLLQEHPQRSHVEKFSDYVEDLHTFVHDHVKPHAKRILLAHSMGGGIAALYLEQEKYKHDFTAAVLVTPMAEPQLAFSTKIIARLNRPIARWAASGYAVLQHDYQPPPFVQNDLTHSAVRYEKIHEIYRNNPGAALGGVTHGWIHEAYDASVQAREQAGEIEIPVLLLQASADTAVGSKAQEQFCRNMKAGLCKGYVMEQSFHAMLMEADTFRVPALTKVFDFMKDPAKEMRPTSPPPSSAPPRAASDRGSSSGCGSTRASLPPARHHRSTPGTARAS